MNIRTQISLIILVAAIVWTAVLMLSKQPITLSMAGPFGTATGITTLVAIGFSKFVWKWKWLRKWLVERPDLSGTWKAKLTSNYKVRGKNVEKVVYVVINQSLTDMSFRLYTEKARSTSLSESISCERNGLFNLAVSYQNVPDVDQRDKDSQIHYGAALFTHIDYESSPISGHYWTDRDTRGALVLQQKVDKFATSYDQAQAMFSQSTAA